MHRMLIVFRLEKYYAFEFSRTSFYLKFFRDKSIRTNINTKRRHKFIQNPNEERSFYIIFGWLINNVSIRKDTVQDCESDIHIIIPWKFIMNRRKKPNHFPHCTFSFSLICCFRLWLECVCFICITHFVHFEVMRRNNQMWHHMMIC